MVSEAGAESLLVVAIGTLVVGAIAGWLASKIMAYGFGFWADAALGILGAFIGSFGIYTVGLIAGIIKATVSAVIVWQLQNCSEGTPPDSVRSCALRMKDESHKPAMICVRVWASALPMSEKSWIG